MLRHHVPFGGLEGVDRTVEYSKVLKRFRPPEPFSFRRGGDITALAELVKSNTQVDVSAAVGAGKSTSLPVNLSKALGKLVVHTIPFHIAARHLAEYLMSREGADGDKIVYMDDLNSDMPKRGVVITTNAFMLAWFAQNGLRAFDGAVLFLDESHESDAATAVLRASAPALALFSCVVRATATSDPGLALKNHLPGTREEKKYRAVATTTWSAHDVGVPWAASEINGNTLMCLDRADVRARLQSEYISHGFDVRVCTARSTYEEFSETVKRLRDPAAGIVIVIVDYAYRSSFTLPCVSHVIDSCEIAVPVVEDGRPVVRYRAAYDFEVQQFLGRGGRLDNDKVVLWKSNAQLEKAMCDIESLECDAANILYRLLGFMPPREMNTYEYYTGPVPIDIAAAMKSAHPLKLCPPESRVPWVNGDKLLIKDPPVPEYKYQLDSQSRGRPKTVTPARPVSPPPQFSARHAVSRFDVEDLDKFSSSRETSPVGTAYTVRSEAPDNVSIFDEDSEFRAFAKPKRKALRLREQSASSVKADAAPAEAVVAKELPALPVEEQAVPSQEAGQISVRRMQSGLVETARAVHATVSSDAGVEDYGLSDSTIGSYLYYHGMDRAPRSSRNFVDGVNSVVSFAEPQRRRYLQGLSSDERLYAVRVLVDASNENTAIAMGIQRLFDEVSGRPPEEMRDLMEPAAMMEVIEWMTTKATEAQVKVKTCQMVLPWYLDKRVDVIPPAVDLENRVMVEMMKRFEKAAIKKDPDKAADYMRAMNERVIRIGQPSRRGTTTLRLK